MFKLLQTTSALALVMAANASFAQDAPAGAAATGCNVNQYSPVTSARTGELLYWTNPTCPAGSGPTDAGASPPPPPDETDEDNGADDDGGADEDDDEDEYDPCAMV